MKILYPLCIASPIRKLGSIKSNFIGLFSYYPEFSGQAIGIIP